MKKFYFIIVVCFMSFLFNDFAFSQRRVRSSSSTKRASSSKSTKRAGSTSAVRGATSSSKKTTSSKSTKRAATGKTTSAVAVSSRTSSKSSSRAKKSSSKMPSKSSSKKVVVSSSKTEEEDELPETISCLKNKILELLNGSCKFVIDEGISSSLGDQDLYCVYSYKDSGKTKSIANYYLNAYYGISSSSVKENTSIVNIKNNSKNAFMYYQYLIDEIAKGTLKESKILDSVMETVLENASLDAAVISTIENKSIESVPLSINVIASDIENCEDAAKLIMRECGAVGNREAKEAITNSCSVYESAVVKLAGDKKAEALGYENEIIDALKERANVDFYAFQDLVEKESEKLSLKKQQYQIEVENKIFDNKSKRADLVSKLEKLEAEIAKLSDGSTKTSKQNMYNSYLSQICNIDKTLYKLDSKYIAPDDLCGTSEGGDTEEGEKSSES